VPIGPVMFACPKRSTRLQLRPGWPIRSLF